MERLSLFGMNELILPNAYSSADRFNAWYIPHCVQLADDWYSRHPRTVACAPLTDGVSDGYRAERVRADAEYAAKIANGSLWST
jgi:hypothetical protein